MAEPCASGAVRPSSSRRGSSVSSPAYETLHRRLPQGRVGIYAAQTFQYARIRLLESSNHIRRIYVDKYVDGNLGGFQSPRRGGTPTFWGEGARRG